MFTNFFFCKFLIPIFQVFIQDNNNVILFPVLSSFSQVTMVFRIIIISCCLKLLSYQTYFNIENSNGIKKDCRENNKEKKREIEEQVLSHSFYGFYFLTKLTELSSFHLKVSRLSELLFLHMDTPVLGDQQKITFINCVDSGCCQEQ